MTSVLKETKSKFGEKIVLLGDEKCNSILVVGVFHGEEPQGKFLIEEYLKIHASSNLLFIPCLNPDGLLNFTRCNSNEVDLNRNFPTKNWELTEKNKFYGGKCPQSEIETKFMLEVIEEYNPKLILTLHAPYKVVNYDGPAEKIAEMISEIINYPVAPSIGYSTPGSFGTYCGVERKIPTITLELDEKCPVQDLKEPVFKIFDMLQFLNLS